jgi:hypothetical protein
MTSHLVQALVHVYALLARLYPRSFRARFEDEMRDVFAAALDQAARQGIATLVHLCLRELCDAPPALLKAHRSIWRNWTRATKHFPVSSLSLPRPSPDGRASWAQAWLEASLFLWMGAILVLLTYSPLALRMPVPSRGTGDGGTLWILLPIPLLVAGLARGLPRWAYPSGGMVFGYSLLVAIRFRQLPALATSALAFAVLLAAALAVHWWVRPLPAWLWRLGQSVRVDRTRLCFCVYGAMPLTIAAAFDDAHLNNRTPYLAVAVLSMVAGALAYARSRRTTAQMAALLGGTSLCLVCALLDHVHSIGAMGPWIAESGWLIRLWATVSALTCAPFLFSLAWRALQGREGSGL